MAIKIVWKRIERSDVSVKGLDNSLNKGFDVF
jgi:hypothetical protein